MIAFMIDVFEYSENCTCDVLFVWLKMPFTEDLLLKWKEITSRTSIFHVICEDTRRYCLSLGPLDLSYKTGMFYLLLHKNYNFLNFLACLILWTLLFPVNFCIVWKSCVIKNCLIMFSCSFISYCKLFLVWSVRVNQEPDRVQRLLHFKSKQRRKSYGFITYLLLCFL